MRYISLFSGIEAASVAWMPLGWEAVAFCEVDEFPCAVLQERFPNVPNLGDVCEVDWEEFHARYGSVDVLVGGSPCQSFSIAGNREGLEGESRLMFEYIRAIRDLVRASGGQSPRYILWENVPGALSSERGNAFGQLLAELDELGYGLAWRVLDAQFARVPDGSPTGFFGPVAQRRRRVFLVGVLGSPHAAEILFERESLRWDHPSSREARKVLASDPSEGPTGGGCAGFKWFAGARAKGIGYEDGTSPTLSVSDGHVPAVLSVRTANTGANGVGVDEELAYTLDLTNANAVAFAQNTRDEVRLFGGDGQTVGALSAQPGMKQTSYFCIGSQQGGAAIYENLSPTVTASAGMSGNNQPVICMTDTQSNAAIGDIPTITAHAAKDAPVVIDRAAFNQGANAQYPPPYPAAGLHGDAGGQGTARGFVQASNGGEVIGTICARDHKGVGSEYVSEGKVICQQVTS